MKRLVLGALVAAAVLFSGSQAQAGGHGHGGCRPGGSWGGGGWGYNAGYRGGCGPRGFQGGYGWNSFRPLPGYGFGGRPFCAPPPCAPRPPCGPVGWGNRFSISFGF